MVDDKETQIRNLAAKVKTLERRLADSKERAASLLRTVRQQEMDIGALSVIEPPPALSQVLAFAKLVNTKVDILGGVYRTETRPDIACWLDAERLMKEILRDIAILEGGVK